MGSRKLLPMGRAVKVVRRLAKTAGLKAVARNAVLLRIIDRSGKLPPTAQVEGKRADVPRTRRALGIVQADHTPVDMVIVDDVKLVVA